MLSAMGREQERGVRAAHYVEVLRERFETKGLLTELAQYPNFVVWRYHLVDGQQKKPPFDPRTHQLASPTERSTWGTLETAFQALASGKFQGIGFMLSHSPYGGIDLDHSVVNGTLVPWARAMVEAMDTYTEYSPSFRRSTGEGGVHILFEGKPPKSRKLGNVEIYGEKRYLTITTYHLGGTPTTIHSRQTELESLYASLVPVSSRRAVQNTSGGVSGVPRSDLPPEAEGDDLLQRLLRGDMAGFSSQSSADFVLIMKLLHWTGDDRALTRQLFLSSPFGQREKATRSTGEVTYVDMTINNVIRKRRNPPMRR